MNDRTWGNLDRELEDASGYDKIIWSPSAWNSIEQILWNPLPNKRSNSASRVLVWSLAQCLYKVLFSEVYSHRSDGLQELSPKMGEILQLICTAFTEYVPFPMSALTDSNGTLDWGDIDIHEKIISWLITWNTSQLWVGVTISEYFAYELLKLYEWKIRSWLMVQEDQKNDPGRYTNKLELGALLSDFEWEWLLSDFEKFSYAINCLWVYVRSKSLWAFPVHHTNTKIVSNLKSRLTELQYNYEKLKNELSVKPQTSLTIVKFFEKLEELYRSFQSSVWILESYWLTPEQGRKF